MSKKLVIIGRGTAGCYALSHFHTYTDWNIELYYDENIPQQAVGEGATLSFPRTLYNNLNFRHYDLKKIDGSPKLGIYKKYWSSKEFIHDFIPPEISYHFNAIKLQDYILNQFKESKRVKIKNTNISKEKIDADFIMDCSGKPKDFTGYHIFDSIPVNSVYITQCPCDKPLFENTLTIARPYGWVFGIPLQNRCSIGYLYNKNFSELPEIKEDVKNVFNEFKLTPSEKTNQFNFDSYKKIINFKDNICFNGNASFFLEPLEATSISTMDFIQRGAFDLWHQNRSYEQINQEYHEFLEKIETIICLHYLSGSVFDTEFWKMAENLSVKKMKKATKQLYFKEILSYLKTGNNKLGDQEHGTWPVRSYKQNILGLEIEKKLLRSKNND